MSEHSKYYWDTERNKPFGEITLSCPAGLEFNTPYTLEEIKEAMSKPSRKDYPVYTGVLKYFPDNMPCARGEKAIHPICNFLRVDNKSFSTHLFIIEYEG